MKARPVLLVMLTVVSLSLVSLWFLGHATFPAHAQSGGVIRYVAPGGVLEGDCTSSSNPCGRVQYAEMQASDGDEIHVAAGNYTDIHLYGGTYQIVYIDKTVTVRGGYSADFSAWDPTQYTTTLDAQGAGRVVYITGNISPTLEGLRLLNGDAGSMQGGDVYINQATVTISGCYISGGTAQGGGGLYVKDSHNVVISGNTIVSNTAEVGGGLDLYFSDYATLAGNTVINNTASDSGGGLYLGSSDNATVRDNTIISNTAQSGNGGGLYHSSNNATLTHNTVISNTALFGGGLNLWSSNDNVVRDNTITGNTAHNDGGGLYLYTSNRNTIADNTVNANTAAGDGGGLYLKSDYPYATADDNTISGNTVSANTATGDGGGLYLKENAGVTVEDNTFNGNTAQDGGGLYLYLKDDDGAVNDNTFSANSAKAGGGGLYLTNSNHATLGGNTVTGNTASAKGGGLYLYSGAELHGNAVVGNAALEGGGFYLSYSDGAVRNGTIISNTANRGGGLYLLRSDARLENDIIAENAATDTGGGLYVRGSAPTGNPPALRYSTLARNRGPAGICVTEFAFYYSHVVMTDTILVSHTVGISVAAGNTATLQATLWGSGQWANGADWGGAGRVATGTVNLWADPGFVNPVGRDYHILPTSAAVDAGVDAGVTTDIDGDPRPSGSGYDIGADEYVRRELVRVTLSGPTEGVVGRDYTFIAAVNPTSTTPLTYVWQATAHSPVTHTGNLSDSISLTWDITGTHHLTVTAQSGTGRVTAARVITIAAQPTAVFTIAKSVAPRGAVAYGDALTYTLIASTTAGTVVRLYDPLAGTTFVHFVTQPPDVLHADNVITGTLTLTPTTPTTVAFVVRVDVPGTVGGVMDVSNRACLYPVDGVLDDCVWSRTVTNSATHLYGVYLPLVLRAH